ncbi:MAG: PSD1 and planctomycete cytochrome C domain-containing protein [Candidatus Poribacteria bacterium]|nr:PSD1 and planctomycete cytochrome C domain-containing protein [Candidatus Poribacteria bacterium]
MKIANTTIPLIALLACFCLAVLGLSTASAEHHETEQANINYNLDIRPILANNCYACHGPDAKARQANLRLDTKAGAFSEPSGYPIIVPNKPEESELHLRIISDDDTYRMPPAGFNKTLTPEQIEAITQWIREGAKWEEHWAFTTPVSQTPPDVKNDGWVRNPIDAFILSRLEKEGLQPASEADKRTLIRRLSFDLTGLPPTREEIHQFLADDSPDAYEKVIDAFMAKPEYGEHLARFWLDVARYGDTHGLHLDNYREMWPYRDWVIEAFTKNMPFDQFTIEQLAGDLLPEPTLEQKIATGFNRCHVTTSEGGSIDEEYYVQYAIDRADTTSSVWMGLTVGCAQCHDHKYDPITQKEFYQLYAYFNNITENAMDGNRKDSPPVVKLPTPEQEAELAAFDEQITELDAQTKAPIPELDATQIAWENRIPHWTTLKPTSLSSKGGATLEVLEDNSILASGTNPEQETYEVIVDLPPGKWSAVRLEGIKHESLPKGGIGRSSNGNVVLTDFALFIAPPAPDDSETPAETESTDTEANAETQAEAGSTVDADTEEAQAENTPAAETETEAETESETTADTEAEGTPTDDASVEGETESTDPDDPWTPIQVVQAWADHEQVMGEGNLGGVIANAIDDKPETGWALDRRNQNRQAIFLVAAPFGTEGGQLKIRLKHEFDLRQKQLGRFRLALTDAATIYPIGSKIGLGNWHAAGPFTAEHGNLAFYQVYEPETKNVNTGATYEVNGKTIKWEQQTHWVDEQVHNDIVGENSATYLFRNISSVTQQKALLHIGSNDALKVWMNGTELLAKNVQRDAAADQEQVQVNLKPGNNTLLLKVVNYSGPSGFYFRLESAPPMIPSNIVDIAGTSRGERETAQKDQIRDYYRRNIPLDKTVNENAQRAFADLKDLFADLSEVQGKRNTLDGSLTTTLVMQEREEPRGAYVLARGEYQNREEQVYPQTPAILSPMPEDTAPNRLGFAKWLLSPEHPLTARVAINRFWQNVFGMGIVKTSEDFGTQGTPPVHPELLDWLATEFIASGWDVQTMLKLMLTSATYRQSAQVTPEKLERDADNALLSRSPRYRLDAEIVRDNALALSNLLYTKVGGPSVKPPQPDGLWKAVGFTGSNTDTFVKDTGADKVYRRSLYTFWKRTAPPPQMNILDAPSREACTIRRERTNTPMQALMLMNDPQFFEAARAFAERTIKEGGETPEARIAYIFEMATARLPKPKEETLLLETFQIHHQEFEANPEAAKELIAVGESPPDETLDAVEVAAWTMIANLILNLDEVLNKG